MIRISFRIAFVFALAGVGIVIPAKAQVQNFKPVTSAELANPSPNDWLSFSRTYDDQRFSPLNQITRQNVGQLRMAWSRGMPAGTVESTPLVRGGTMYVMTSTGGMQALNAPTGTCCGNTRVRSRLQRLLRPGRGVEEVRAADAAARLELTTRAPKRWRSSTTCCFTRPPTVTLSLWTRAPANCAGKARWIIAATLRARSWPETK